MQTSGIGILSEKNCADTGEIVCIPIPPLPACYCTDNNGEWISLSVEGATSDYVSQNGTDGKINLLSKWRFFLMECQLNADLKNVDGSYLTTKRAILFNVVVSNVAIYFSDRGLSRPLSQIPDWPQIQ